MKFLDTNVLAYAFYNNPYSEYCQKAIQSGGITDTFSLIEAFGVIEYETSRERAIRSIRSLLQSHLQIIDLDINIIFESIKRMHTHKLSIYDAVHYTCALLTDCSAILTYDKGFNNLRIPREEP